MQLLVQKWALAVATAPRSYILWPASLAFVLSYVTIYSLFTEQLPSVRVSIGYNGNNPITSLDPSTPPVYIKQLLVYAQSLPHYSDPHAVDALSPLLHLDSFNESALPRVHCAWTPNGSLALDWQSISSLRSVIFSPTFSGLPNSQYSDLNVAALLVSYLYENPSDGAAWDNAVRKAMNNGQYPISTESTILPPEDVHGEPSPDHLQYYNFFPGCPFPWLTIGFAWAVTVAYMWIVLTDNESILSQAGLAVTFIVQMLLCITSSLTATSLFVPRFSHYHIRQFVALPYLTTVIGIQQMLGLLNAISKTPPENFPLSRISAAAAESIPQSTKRVGFACILLAIGTMPWLGFSVHAVGLCVFMIVSLITCLALHVTFFLAVLSVDLRRLELQDLISYHAKSMRSRMFRPLDHSMGTPGWITRLAYLTRSGLYLNRLYLKQRAPAATSFILFILILIYLRLVSAGHFTENLSIILRHPSGRAVLFFAPVSKLLSRPVQVYDPVVVYGRQSEPRLVPGPALNGALSPPLYGFVTPHLLMEFCASLGFITSLTGIVLKFILPRSIEVPDEEPPTETRAQYSSKDLIGFHPVDVISTSAHGSWLAAVTLDHKVTLWNVIEYSRDRSYRPISIPFPPQFWPLSKVQVNCTLGLVGLFSKNSPSLLLWNYKTMEQQLLVEGTERFSVPPVHAFYYQRELLIVTRDGELLSFLPFSGQMKRFRITDDKIVSATSLFTPKMSAQIVCSTAGNDVVVGQYVNGDWTFRVLRIRESLSAAMKTQRDPLFSAQISDEYSLSRPHHPLESDSAIPSTRPCTLPGPIKAVVPVSAINMVLLTFTTSASLMDVQTGVILQHFHMGYFKRGSLRVFHSRPAHCRFCGSVSVESLSIAYCDSEDVSTVIMHTFTIENRARNNICLRVERDPRETRCLGFDATTEQQHWVCWVEGWDKTEMNMLLGVRRKVEGDRPESESSDSTPSPTQTEGSSSSTGLSLSDLAPRLLHQRRHRFMGRGAPDSPNDADEEETIWEGWSMKSTGELTVYDLPNFIDVGKAPTRDRRQLLVEKIGGVAQFGRNSVSVIFGNTVKVMLYGSDESFLSDLENPEIMSENARIVTKSRRVVPTPQGPVSAAKKWRRGIP